MIPLETIANRMQDMETNINERLDRQIECIRVIEESINNMNESIKETTGVLREIVQSLNTLTKRIEQNNQDDWWKGGNED